MGSFRSGRRSGEACIEDVWRLDVRPLARDGLLRPGRSFTLEWGTAGASGTVATMRVISASEVHVSVTRPKNPTRADVAYPLRLDHTKCHWGGTRAWWICPAIGCGRRAAVLYGFEIFACRRCYRLAYRSQRETPENRAFRAADRIRARLGWCPGIANGYGLKPPRMHWTTFFELLRQYNQAVAAAVGPAAERVRQAERRLMSLRGPLGRLDRGTLGYRQ